MDFQTRKLDIIGAIQHKNNYVTGERVHFFPFFKFNPIYGKVNIAFISDIRSKQLNSLKDSNNVDPYLSLDKQRFKSLAAMVTLNGSFAGDVMNWYGDDNSTVDWFQFLSYPNKIKSVAPKRKEIVFIDNATCFFQDEFYSKLIQLLDALNKNNDIDTKIVCSSVAYSNELRVKYKNNLTDCIGLDEYDYRSKYGLLVDIMDYDYLQNCLPRKLMIYLHCGMKPLVHSVFEESIKFIKDNNVVPLVFDDIEDIDDLLYERAPNYNRQLFSMEYRINGLINFINSVENSHKYESKKYYP
jgi:hypothetical protein